MDYKIEPGHFTLTGQPVDMFIANTASPSANSAIEIIKSQVDNKVVARDEAAKKIAALKALAALNDDEVNAYHSLAADPTFVVPDDFIALPRSVFDRQVEKTYDERLQNRRIKIQNAPDRAMVWLEASKWLGPYVLVALYILASRLAGGPSIPV